ncbi:amino acid/polyamine/organocation transporter (APC superfamily) [Labedella gwakjiensis]|uniref:APC family permease n=1 Tax=Labedella gwakjiensis TaxID=390269 RepID=A0A2P8GYX4_9MICO|nr:APC family permease [Labedella gwakjiensis]PSL39174.1 amino acid/polyamine/organocation transporter (APC superfamily) [Labedella gwakjiensis]RUQ86392.1 APC family permease [Labedella gwakjiensis]
MSSRTADEQTGAPSSELKRSITGRLLFFYVLGDVLGSGIYVLIGAVAGEVGGAFWIAFAVGVTVATITGLAYAELVTKYPQAAGAALYVNKAFKLPVLTFLVTISMLSASFAATASLANGFARYFGTIVPYSPALLITLVFVVLLAVVNFVGITESVVANLIMTIIEISGLAIVLVVGIIHVSQGAADFGVLVQFDTGETFPIFAIVAGVALAFFAMTGFENAANVAEETVNPSKTFPRALVGGMVAAGVIYVLVAMTAALVVPVDTLAESDAALLEVIKAGILPVSVAVMIVIFAIIAMVAITNTTLVAVVTQSRILYGMAREDIVPSMFGKIHRTRRSPWVALLFAAVIVMSLLVVGAMLNDAIGIDVVTTLANVTVVFLLFIYGLVIVAALKLRGKDEHGESFRANTPLLYVGLLGNAVLLVYVVVDDPSSLLWVAGLLAVGVALYVAEKVFGHKKSPSTATDSIGTDSISSDSNSTKEG